MYSKFTKRFKKRSAVRKIYCLGPADRNSSVHKVTLLSNLRTTRRSLFFFKKKFKKIFKKKNIYFRINIIPNYNVSYKGKNPRMGGGIGFYTKSIFQGKPSKPLFLSKNINIKKLTHIVSFFKKKIKFLHKI